MPEKVEASWTPAIKEEFARLWRAGVKSAAIGARFDMRQNMVCKIAARLGLPARGRGWHPTPAPTSEKAP